MQVRDVQLVYEVRDLRAAGTTTVRATKSPTSNGNHDPLTCTFAHARDDDRTDVEADRGHLDDPLDDTARATL